MIRDRNIALDADIDPSKIIGGLSGAPLMSGAKYLYVDSNNGNDNLSGRSAGSAKATIQGAIDAATASKNDVIYVMPYHTETLATAGAITADKIGVKIIGIGSGNERPKLTLSATDSTIAVTAANVLFKNIVITGSVAELVTVFNVTAAGCTLDRVDYAGGATSTIKFMTTSAAADKLNIQNCVHTTTAAVTANAWWIQLTGADDARIINNHFHIVTSNNAASGAIGGLTTASLRVFIKYNDIYVLGTSVLPLSMLAGTTGILAYNNVGCSKTAAAGGIQPASCYCIQNFITNVVTTSGKLDPVATA